MSERLSAAQRDLLTRLSEGEQIVYSQDGDIAWLMPSDYRLDHVKVEEFSDLRERRLIGSDPAFDEDEAYRFGPNDVITDLGRTALRSDGGNDA